MSVAFLFGAGASAFSGECYPANPPLGRDLFVALKASGSVIAGSVSPDLAQIFEDDFELGMAEFRSRRETETTALVREMASFFCRFVPGEKNFYSSLIRILLRAPRPAVLATLNYDLLLEIAVSINGAKIAYHGLPAPQGNVSILKLHGSCNFLPDLGRGSIRGIGFDLSAVPDAAILDAPIKIVDVPAVLKFCREEDALSPAMALYAKGKGVLISPKFVRFQQTEWAKAVHAASQIFVIGARLVEEDAHVWKPLGSSKASLFYIGPDAKPFRDWAAACKRRQAYHLTDSFQEALPEIEKRILRIGQ